MLARPLQRLSVLVAKLDPQARMPVRQLLQGPAQRRGIEFAANAGRKHDIVGPAFGRELPQEPERLLTVRQRVPGASASHPLAQQASQPGPVVLGRTMSLLGGHFGHGCQLALGNWASSDVSSSAESSSI